MTIPSVTCGSDQVVPYSAAPQTVQLSATATNSPTSWRWEVIAAPAGSSYASEVRGDFTNGVATVQNPQFVTDSGLYGTYVIQLVASNANGSSRPRVDREDAQQNVVVQSVIDSLGLPGDGQYNWGTYNNTNLVLLEAHLDTLQTYVDNLQDSIDSGTLPVTHSTLLGLSADDHIQYHNDTRGDVRYHTKSEFLNTSTGAGDAGKPVKLDTGGVLNPTIIAHTLGGAAHTADTLANLNALISDATLIDTADSRLSDDRNDADAVHFSVSDEFGLLAQKDVLDGTEQLLIEANTGDAWEKQYIVASGISNLLQINELQIKEDSVDEDLILIEDSENGNVRMAMTVSGLLSHWWKTDTFPFSYWTDMQFPSTAINPPGAASDPTRSTTTGLLEFSASAENAITGIAQLPHGWKEGSEVHPHIHHRAKTDPSGTGNVVWELKYKWYNNNETVPALYTSGQKVFTLSDFSGGLQVADVDSFDPIDGTGMRDSSIIEWRLARLGSEASDNYAGVDVLVEFDIHILMNGFGSLDEFPGA